MENPDALCSVPSPDSLLKNAKSELLGGCGVLYTYEHWLGRGVSRVTLKLEKGVTPNGGSIKRNLGCCVATKNLLWTMIGKVLNACASTTSAYDPPVTFGTS